MPANKGSDWDRHWKSMETLRTFYEKIQSKQFKMYRDLIGKRLNTKSKVLELGGGTGGLSVRFLDYYKCNCTIIDNSCEAKKFFDKSFANKKLQYKRMDAFRLKEKNKYDLVFSDGLIEHFEGKTQEKLIQVHKNSAKKNGFVILVVPRKSKRYKVITKTMKALRLWNLGFEKPYSLQDLKILCKENGLKVIKSARGFWEIGVLCSKK
ncbi:methyltransferase domain-containing protein [Candidatus Micrarchaeota archaeon]|nr:methyltransferase domain-containing protein [Candidatus Micrarchaeota archaeon]